MIPDITPARRAVTAVVLAVALFAAVVVQLTVVNRLPLPDGARPDLVLLLVSAIAVTVTPLTAVVTGFAGGLALDIAPPAAHYAGEYALVFCLTSYAAARAVAFLWDLLGARDTRLTLAVLAVTVAAGETGKAAVGLLLSDPDVTGPAIARVLPGGILADLLLASLVYWAVHRLATPVPATRAEQPLETGRVPRLRLAGTGERYQRPPSAGRVPHLPLADPGGKYRRPTWARHVPRLADASSLDRHRTTPASYSPRTFTMPRSGRPGRGRRLQPSRNAFPVAGRTKKVHFRGDLHARTAPRRKWSPVRT